MSPELSADESRHIAALLAVPKVVAVVGASDKPQRASYQVMAFLQAAGWTVIPVNPTLAGHSILGVPCCASLRDAPPSVQMVDVFRASDALPSVVDEILALKADGSLPHLSILWTQLGVRHEEATEKARQAGLTVVVDRCPKIEWARLLSSAAPAAHD